MTGPGATVSTTVELTARDGHRLAGYLALPEQPTGSGGLVLLHEIFGINPYLRTMAETFAGHGFPTLVPDLFARQEKGVELGYGEADFAHAIALRDALDPAAAVDDITAATQFLRDLDTGNGRVGALGYCLGGGLAVLAAAHCGVDAAVSYYGVGVQDRLHLAGQIGVPLLFHFAEHDHYCPPPARHAIEEAFADHTDVEFYLYGGVGHAFATYGRDTFDEAATRRAFDRTLPHLERWLG